MEIAPAFSLLREPWIPCEAMDGGTVHLSIRDVFDGAHEVREIRGDSPPQSFAILRVLLAIFWRAHHPETQVATDETFDFAEWFEDTWELIDEPDEAVLRYLEEYENRFYLIHPKAPFMQVADLHTVKGERDPVTRIIPDAQATYFTMRSGAGATSLSLAEAARNLIYVQAYDYAGIKSGAVGDPRVKKGKGYGSSLGWNGFIGGTVILGKNLRETLLLNTVAEVLTFKSDHPVWEREPDTAMARADRTGQEQSYPEMPQGPADLATWQSRRVRLFIEDGLVVGVMVSNGDKIPDAGANILIDPMTPYRYSKGKSKKDKPVYYASRFSAWRTTWQAIEPLIMIGGDPGTDTQNSSLHPRTLSQLADLELDIDLPDLVDVRLISVEYGVQSAVVETVVDQRVGVAMELLRQNAGQQRALVAATVAATKEAGKWLGVYGGQLLQAGGGEYEFDAKSTDSLLATVEPRFLLWLRRMRLENLESHVSLWHSELFEVILSFADEMLRSAGSKAWVGSEISGEGQKIISAETAYRQLIWRLNKVLNYRVKKNGGDNYDAGSEK